MKRALFILLLLCAVLFSGCSSQSQQGAEKKVYASTYPVYYLTGRIAENGIEVAAVVPSSADPHNWEPSPRQMAELESCKLFIYNGAGLEPWADKVSSLAGDNDTAVLELASVFQGQLIDGSGKNWFPGAAPGRPQSRVGPPLLVRPCYGKGNGCSYPGSIDTG